MKYYMFVAVLVATVAHAENGTPIYWSSVQSCTAGTCTTAAPSGAITDGQTGAPGRNLLGVRGFHLQVCAASGQTLSGAGTLDGYWYSYNSANPIAWAYSVAVSQTITSAWTGKRCAVFPTSRTSDGGLGSLYIAANGITVSGGASITIMLDGWY